MLIAVDGFEASSTERVGVGRLEVELLKSISVLDRKNSYRVYTPRHPKNDLPRYTKNWNYVIPPFTRLWSQAALPWKIIVDRPAPDVFYSPVHYAPRYCPVPLVVGIMDLSYIHFPGLFRKADFYKLKNWTKYSIERADAVIAISNSTKSDILNTYTVDPENVHVVYPGLSDLGSHEGEKSKSTTANKMASKSKNIQKKYGIEKDYILYVGTLQPRKNLIRLIQAFKIANNRYRTDNAGEKLQLVIVGKKGWMYDEILDKASELGIDESVIFTGYIPDEELPPLYSGAACFCLPSLYEGFGFPVLEAMKYGSPVVVSNVSSLPEIVGEAGVLVNPESVDSIAGGIEKVLTMKKHDLDSIVKKGKKQADTFTWEKAAKKTIAILEKVGTKNSV